MIKRHGDADAVALAVAQTLADEEAVVDEVGANAGGGILDDDPLVTVGRPDADAVAGVDAEGEQGTGALRGGVPEPAVGGAIVLRADNEGVALAVTFDGRAEVVANGLA